MDAVIPASEHLTMMLGINEFLREAGELPELVQVENAEQFQALCEECAERDGGVMITGRTKDGRVGPLICGVPVVLWEPAARGIRYRVNGC